MDKVKEVGKHFNLGFGHRIGRITHNKIKKKKKNSTFGSLTDAILIYNAADIAGFIFDIICIIIAFILASKCKVARSLQYIVAYFFAPCYVCFRAIFPCKK